MTDNKEVDKTSPRISRSTTDPEKCPQVSTTHDIEEEPDLDTSSIIIIRNASEDSPNLTFNAGILSSKTQLYIVALAGTILQLGTVVYFAVATYYTSMGFQKGGKAFASYAFPTAAAGTALLVAGMALCSYVIEKSTREAVYYPAEGRTARLVWLQKSGIVNDQAFKSFAIFPNQSPTRIITSRREDKVADTSEARPFGDRIKISRCHRSNTSKQQKDQRTSNRHGRYNNPLRVYPSVCWAAGHALVGRARATWSNPLDDWFESLDPPSSGKPPHIQTTSFGPRNRLVSTDSWGRTGECALAARL